MVNGEFFVTGLLTCPVIFFQPLLFYIQKLFYRFPEMVASFHFVFLCNLQNGRCAFI